MATEAPSAANAIAVALPMPEPPPVMYAVLPLNLTFRSSAFKANLFFAFLGLLTDHFGQRLDYSLDRFCVASRALSSSLRAT